MRKLIVTLLSEAAWICVALLVGPLFPLGDWRWGALVFGFLAILLFMYRYEVAHLSAVVLDRIRIAVTRNSATDEPAWEKVYTARSAADLFEAVNTRTSANAAKYIQPHIGKWIKIQNTVKDISEDEHYFYVHLGKWFDPTPYLQFEKNSGDQKSKRWIEVIASLRKEG